MLTNSRRFSSSGSIAIIHAHRAAATKAIEPMILLIADPSPLLKWVTPTTARHLRGGHDCERTNDKSCECERSHYSTLYLLQIQDDMTSSSNAISVSAKEKGSSRNRDCCVAELTRTRASLLRTIEAVIETIRASCIDEAAYRGGLLSER
jgi:hypothetical protein